MCKGCLKWAGNFPISSCLCHVEHWRSSLIPSTSEYLWFNKRKKWEVLVARQTNPGRGRTEMYIRQLQLQAVTCRSWSKPQCKGRKGLGGDVSYCVTAMPWHVPKTCPWNYVILSFHCCLSSCLCHLQDLPSAFTKWLVNHCCRWLSLTLRAEVPRSFTATAQGSPDTSSSWALQSKQLSCLILIGPTSNEGDAELNSRNREEVEISWSSESVAVSKMDGVEVTPCSINWVGTALCPSELSPAFSLHLHKTPGNFAAENKDHLKATIILCLAMTGI